MQTALYGKIKERKGEWLVGVNTQNVLYLSIVATQHKTKQSRVRRVLITGKARRCVRRISIMGKTLRREGAQGAQFSRLAYDIYYNSTVLKH